MDLRTLRRALMAQGGSGPVYEHGTWEDLLQKIDNGTYATEYAVGETLPFVISGTDYQAQIVAFNTDTLAGDGVTDKAAVSFVAVKLLNDYRRMNPAYQANTEGTGGIGGWPKCEMRTYLNGTFIDLVPTIIRNRIVQVKKYSRIWNASETTVNNVLSEDKIWIPCAREIGFTGTETSGPSYSSVFNSNSARIKIRYSTARAYWTRTISGSYKERFSICSTVGSNTTTAASSTSTGVCVSFCVN